MARKKKSPKWPTEQRSRALLGRVVRVWKQLSDKQKQYIEYRVIFAISINRQWLAIQSDRMEPLIIGEGG